jgi:hypothetical protein
MATVVMTTRIDRAPADVFAVLADVSKNTTWSKTSISGRLLSPPPVGLGTTAREVSRFMGRRIEVDSTIVAFDSDRTFTFVTSTGPFPFRGSFTTDPDGAGTKLTSEFEAEPTGLLRFADGLFGALIRWKFQGDLANLKRLLESGAL